uniref:golgin IMH1-like n=1 Tax=Erigeron canadensis TaxID=72917 RepID=UPI001CB991AA|nr:golgin IMH1-like [Erigeron canadensis]
MEIVACPGLGGTNCIVVAPPLVDDQKDTEKPKLSKEPSNEGNSENSTESCVERDHKVIDDHNNNDMESWIVVVGDISCPLPINKVSIVDATETNIELEGSVENLEVDENGEGTDDYEQIETDDDQGKEVLVNDQYPSRVIFPPTFVCPEIEIEFGSLGKSTFIFPPEYVCPKLNIKFGSFGDNDDDTNIGLGDLNQETEPLCGENKEDEKVTCEIIEDDKASDAPTEDAAVEFKDGEKFCDTNTMVEDSSHEVIETPKKRVVISNNNHDMIVINLLENEKVNTCGILEEDDTVAGFEDERVSDTDIVVEDSSHEVIETPKCDATSNNNNLDVTLTNLAQLDGQGVGDAIQWVGDLVVINYNALKVVPSFEIEKLNEQIKKARIQLDEKTKLRDAISDKVEKMKKSLRARKNEGVNVANMKISAAKKMVKSKRHEIDYVQRVIKNLKRATSAGEVDNKIFEVKHSTDEKAFVHIKKQLNDIRDQLSSYMASYDEVQQALYLEDRIHEVLKSLNKELKTLKEDVSKAELVTKATSKSYREDSAMEKVLIVQFIAAEAIHQQAFWQLNSLKNRLDGEVEELMYGLKTNEELGTFVSIKQDTLDGPLSQEVAGKSVPVKDEIKQISTVFMEETQSQISFVEEKHSEDQTKEEVAEENKQMMKSKEPANSAEMIDNQEMENIDESRKADELKTEETETKLKEQSQLDEFMKVETNKRNAEKAQTSAEQRAQKEADQHDQKEAMRKEKARLKRLRKKKNKRPCHDANDSNIHDVDLAESNEVDKPRTPILYQNKLNRKSMCHRNSGTLRTGCSIRGRWQLSRVLFYPYYHC